MHLVFYFAHQTIKFQNDGLFYFLVAAYNEWGVGNTSEPFLVVLHHLGPTFINAYIVNVLQSWLIETEGNMGITISFSQRGMHAQSVSSRTDGRLTFYKEFLYYVGFFRYYVKHPLWHCDWVKLSKRIFLIKPSHMCSWWGSFIKNYIFKNLFKLNKDTSWCTKLVHLLCKKRLIYHYQSPQILCTI